MVAIKGPIDPPAPPNEPTVLRRKLLGFNVVKDPPLLRPWTILNIERPNPAPHLAEPCCDESVCASVRKSFLRSARLIHPDKCHFPLSNEAFQNLSWAKEVILLGDKRYRRKDGKPKGAGEARGRSVSAGWAAETAQGNPSRRRSAAQLGEGGEFVSRRKRAAGNEAPPTDRKAPAAPAPAAPAAPAAPTAPTAPTAPGGRKRNRSAFRAEQRLSVSSCAPRHASRR